MSKSIIFQEKLEDTERSRIDQVSNKQGWYAYIQAKGIQSQAKWKQRVCLKEATNLLSLYLCGVGALLRPKFNMTNQEIGINSSSHWRFATNIISQITLFVNRTYHSLIIDYAIFIFETDPFFILCRSQLCAWFCSWSISVTYAHNTTLLRAADKLFYEKVV